MATSPALLLVAGLSLFAAVPDQEVIVVKRATVVAYFAPGPSDEEAGDEPLADFQHYADRAREAFQKAGVDFHEVYASSFQIRIGEKSTTFRPKKDEHVGYYLVKPGKRPRVVAGVTTDTTLYRIVREYFGIVVR